MGVEEKLETLIKTVDQLNVKIDGIGTTVKSIETRVKNIELEVGDVEGRVSKLETDFDFYSTSYEEFKQDIKSTNGKIAELTKENQSLKQANDDFHQQFENERSLRNSEAQYNRSALNLRLTGVPRQAGEEKMDKKCNTVTLETIKKIAAAANMSDFKSEQVDVCHRVGADHYAPIVIRFDRMSYKCNFFDQKSVIAELPPSTCELEEDDAERAEYVKSMKIYNPRFNKERPAFYIQEHLTRYTAELLKQTKIKARLCGYKFPGYVMNSEVRARKVEGGRYIVIKEMKDLDKIQ